MLSKFYVPYRTFIMENFIQTGWSKEFTFNAMIHQINTLTFCFKLESDSWLSFHVSLLSASSFCPSVSFVSCKEKQTPCHRLEQVLSTCCVGDIVSRLRNGSLRNCGLISNTLKISSLFPKCPDWFWHPTNLLFTQYHGLSSLEESSQGMKLTTCTFSA